MKQIRTLNIREAKKAYKQFILPYFPEDEIKPFSSIKRMMKEDGYRVYALCEDKKMKAIGFDCSINEKHKLKTYSPTSSVYVLDITVS